MKIYNETERVTNLDNNPLFKGLLKQYCLMHYEADAILDDYHLIMEYEYLKNNDKLHELFECEMLSNYFEN